MSNKSIYFWPTGLFPGWKKLNKKNLSLKIMMITITEKQLIKWSCQKTTNQSITCHNSSCHPHCRHKKCRNKGRGGGGGGKNYPLKSFVVRFSKFPLQNFWESFGIQTSVTNIPKRVLAKLSFQELFAVGWYDRIREIFLR